MRFVGSLAAFGVWVSLVWLLGSGLRAQFAEERADRLSVRRHEAACRALRSHR